MPASHLSTVPSSVLLRRARRAAASARCRRPPRPSAGLDLSILAVELDGLVEVLGAVRHGVAQHGEHLRSTLSWLARHDVVAGDERGRERDGVREVGVLGELRRGPGTCFLIVVDRRVPEAGRVDLLRRTNADDDRRRVHRRPSRCRSSSSRPSRSARVRIMSPDVPSGTPTFLPLQVLHRARCRAGAMTRSA